MPRNSATFDVVIALSSEAVIAEYVKDAEAGGDPDEIRAAHETAERARRAWGLIPPSTPPH